MNEQVMYKDKQMDELYSNLLDKTGIKFEFRWDKQTHRKPIRCFEWRLFGSSLHWQMAKLPFGFNGDEISTLVKLF